MNKLSAHAGVVADIKKGEVITEENVRSIIPGFGAHPKHFNEIIGSEVKLDLPFGSRMRLDDVL